MDKASSSSLSALAVAGLGRVLLDWTGAGPGPGEDRSCLAWAGLESVGESVRLSGAAECGALWLWLWLWLWLCLLLRLLLSSAVAVASCLVPRCAQVRRDLVADSEELWDPNCARRSSTSPPRFLGGVMGRGEPSVMRGRSAMATNAVYTRVFVSGYVLCGKARVTDNDATYRGSIVG